MKNGRLVRRMPGEELGKECSYEKTERKKEERNKRW